MAIERGIFSSARKAWIAVAAYTVFLYATLTIAYDIFMFYSNQVGPDSVLSYMNMAFVPVGVALLLFIIFSLPRVWGVYLSFALICLGVAFSLQILTIPAKRFHFFQYAPLTVLVFDALRFTIRDRFLYIWTLALVALIGLGDETLQWMSDRGVGGNAAAEPLSKFLQECDDSLHPMAPTETETLTKTLLSLIIFLLRKLAISKPKRLFRFLEAI